MNGLIVAPLLTLHGILLLNKIISLINLPTTKIRFIAWVELCPVTNIIRGCWHCTPYNYYLYAENLTVCLRQIKIFKADVLIRKLTRTRQRRIDVVDFIVAVLR